MRVKLISHSKANPSILPIVSNAQRDRDIENLVAYCARVSLFHQELLLRRLHGGPWRAPREGRCTIAFRIRLEQTWSSKRDLRCFLSGTRSRLSGLREFRNLYEFHN